MKGVVRRNQIIITSLAILIAVAGYLNYTERNVAKQTANKVEKE
ncbi:MAG: SpoIIIAH-like family protein, partial [Lachnospiraceae bacterium]|nr:SpoIIIAH-like family protein [Lachnospiraceae bacterium]